jgi:hypothetical protein
MKFTFVLNQKAVFDAGLVGKVRVQDLCLLHYLRGWFNFDGAKTEIVDGRKFVWLYSERAIEELPLLFNPQARLTSRKNQLSAMIGKLRKAGLVDTARITRRLFFSLTDKAVGLAKRPAPTPTKPSPMVTPPHDEVVTPGQHNVITPLRDEYLPTIIDESGTIKPEIRESPPLSPSEGEAESILALWNSFPELLSAHTITPNRARKIRKRLADRFWREHWRDGIKRVAASDFARGGGPNVWRATLDWFLCGDSLAKILEGAYDNRPGSGRKESPLELKARLQALHKLREEHPGCPGANYSGPPTKKEEQEFSKIEDKIHKLRRQLSGLD